MGKPILCVDFDGVLHSYTSGWKGAAVVSDGPVEGAVEFLFRALKLFDVQIYSSRSNEPGGIRAMRDWLKEHAGAVWWDNFGDLGLESIKFPVEKPPAFLTIDDRAFVFEGKFPEPSALLAFKPWNKR